MRKRKILASVVALTICIIGNIMSVSVAAAVKENNSISITDQENDLEANLINEEKISEKNLKILNRNIKETEDGDFIIREIETTYVPTVHANIQAKAAAYKSEFYTKEYDITHKKTKKRIFHILLDATFKYNNTYAYVADYLVDKRTYNGAKWSGKVQYTSKAKKGNIANVTVTGNLSGKLGGKNFNDKFKFNISCTKKGKTATYAKRL